MPAMFEEGHTVMRARSLAGMFWSVAGGEGAARCNGQYPAAGRIFQMLLVREIRFGKQIDTAQH